MELVAIVVAVFALFLAIGVFVIRAGLRNMKATAAFEAAAQQAPGVVTRVNSRWSGTRDDRKRVFFPVVRYTTAAGQDVETEVAIGGRPSPAQEGQQVTVLYDPADPLSPRLPGILGSGKIVGPIMLFLGICFTIVGGGGLLVAALVAIAAAS